MRLLVMGGIKSGNIISVLAQRYKTSVTYAREDNLANFEQLILRGDTFDRALIFEQAINEDGLLLEEDKQRENIAKFIEKLTENFTKYEVIFVCENESMAKIIFQETMEIEPWSKILVKKPKYFVKFFTDLVSSELRELDKELIFDAARLKRILEEENEEEEIIWSDEVEHIEGEILGGVREREIEINLDDWANESLNLKKEEPAKVEESVEKVETSEEIQEEIEKNNAEQERVKKVKERKKKRLLGLLPKR